MKCVICKHGETRDGTAVVILQRDNTSIIIKEVPAQVCTNCGEYYLSEAITEKVLALAEHAARRGAEIEVLRFAA